MVRRSRPPCRAACCAAACRDGVGALEGDAASAVELGACPSRRRARRRHLPGSFIPRAVPYNAPKRDAAPVYCGRPFAASGCRIRSSDVLGSVPEESGNWLTIPPACSCARAAARRYCCAAAATAASVIAAQRALARHATTCSARPHGATSAAVPGAWPMPSAHAAGASDSDTASANSCAARWLRWTRPPPTS